MIKRLISIFLSLLLVCNGLHLIEDVYAEETSCRKINLNVICNYADLSEQNALIDGTLETKSRNIDLLEKDGTVYMSIQDISDLTRSEVKIEQENYVVSQSSLNIILKSTEKEKTDLFFKVDYEGSTEVSLDFQLKVMVVDNILYCEPEPLLKLLSAECRIDTEKTTPTLLLSMPQFTLFEAVEGFNGGKYNIDILTSGIKDADSIADAVYNYAKGVQRMYIQLVLDTIINCKFEIFNTFATRPNTEQYLEDAYSNVLGYDVFSGKEVAQLENTVYKTYNSLDTLLEMEDDDTDRPFSSFYIESYVQSGKRDQNSLILFKETLETISENEKVMKKLSDYADEAQGSAYQVLFKTVLEYLKRTSYEKDVLEKFITIYKEDTLKKLNLSSDSSKLDISKIAQDYYNSCFSGTDILAELVAEELSNKISKKIILLPLDWASGGAASKALDIYEKVLAAERLKETTSKDKPLESIDNGTSYLMLTIMQNDIVTILNASDATLKKDWSDAESHKIVLSALDMYCRTSMVMIDKLKNSWQFSITSKEEDILTNSEAYVEELKTYVYRFEHCSIPDLSSEGLKKSRNESIFDDITNVSANYTWHLEPTIEAEDIIVSDKDHYSTDISSSICPYDECAIIKNSNKYGIIKYDGSYVAETIYDDFFYDGVYEMTVYTDEDNCCYVFPGEDELDIQFNVIWGRGGSRAYYVIDNTTKNIYSVNDIGLSRNVDNVGYCIAAQTADVTVVNYDSTFNEYSLKIDNLGKYGIIKNSNVVVNLIYDNACMNFGDNIIALKEGEKWGYFDENGNQIIDFVCESFESKVLDGSWWKNDDGNTQYPFLSSSGYIPVKINGQCGYYDTQGNEIIPCGTFEEVRPVHNGLAWVKEDGLWGVIRIAQDETNKSIPTPVDLGGAHSGVITESGNLYMWGENYDGQIGNANNKFVYTPIEIMEGVKFISLGTCSTHRNHSAAITNNGSLYMWGYNCSGQLGNGTTENSNIPIKIMDNVASVSLGDSHSAAITTDGSLYMWGHNGRGNLGDGTTRNSNIPVKIMDNVVSVSVAGFHSAAITGDGSLYMWGYNGSGKLGDGTRIDRSLPIKILENVVSVSLGGNHSAAITEDGNLYTWGQNYFGQLGDGTTVDSYVPIKILENVASVSLGQIHSAAITKDGSLYMWGDNTGGALGDGTENDSSIPIKIMDDVVYVSLGDSFSSAISTDGSLYMWGVNENGQLGNGTTEDSVVPMKVLDNVMLPSY